MNKAIPILLVTALVAGCRTGNSKETIATAKALSPVEEWRRDFDWLQRLQATPYTNLLTNYAKLSKSHRKLYGVWPGSVDEMCLGLGASHSSELLHGRVKYVPFDHDLDYGKIIDYGTDGKPGGTGLDEDVEIRFDAEATTPDGRRDDGTNVFCTVHNELMKEEMIPIIDPGGDIWRPSQYNPIRRRDFPNANSHTMVLHGSGHMFAKSHRARFCDQCRLAEKKWNSIFSGTVRRAYDRHPDAADEVLAELDFDRLAEAPVLLEKADALYANEKYKEALTSGYLKILVFLPYSGQYAEAMFKAGECFGKIDQISHARKMYRRLVTELPDDPFAGKAKVRLAEIGD